MNDVAELDGRSWHWPSIIAVAIPLIALFWDIVPSMVDVWWNDPAYSHGLLIPGLAAYLAWTEQESILAAPVKPFFAGVWVIALGCAIQLVGRLGAEFFLTRISIVIILGGLVLTFWGIQRLRALAFPLILLSTMVPIPAIVYNKMAAPLQLFASEVASNSLEAIGIPVFRDGNVMHLSQITLGVAEACSGLRSMSSLSVLALVIGYMLCRTLPFRTLVFLFAFPTAIGINVFRIVGTALMAREDSSLAEGFFHSFQGMIVFLLGMAILAFVGTVAAKLEGSPREDANQ